MYLAMYLGKAQSLGKGAGVAMVGLRTGFLFFFLFIFLFTAYVTWK